MINNPVGPVLSKKALIDLGIISKDFPYQQQVPVDGELRRPADSMGEAEAAKITSEWNEMAAKVITRWDEMVGDSPDGGSNVSKKTRSQKLAARLERLRGEKRKAKMPQTSIQSLDSFETLRGRDLAGRYERVPSGVEGVTASKEGFSEVLSLIHI